MLICKGGISYPKKSFKMSNMKNENSLVKSRNEAARELGLTVREQKFCELYVNNNELRGNGVRCYAEAFNVDLEKKYGTANTNASRLLAQSHILKFMNLIFEQAGLNDGSVDNELLFAIRQNSDFPSKVAAIKLYNELKGRIKKAKDFDTNIQFNIGIISNS